MAYITSLIANNRPSALWVEQSAAMVEQGAMLPWRYWYAHLWRYYMNNALYEQLNATLYALDYDDSQTKPIRNPAKRAVEFYAAKLWPDASPWPVQAENERIVEPLAQIETWSNWNSNKQLAARWFAVYGDMFLKVATNVTETDAATKVYIQNIRPEFVVDFSVDAQGHVQMIRVDIPDGELIHVEVWDREHGLRTWKHKQGADVDTSKLANPDTIISLSQMGIDFIPFVYQQIQPIGGSQARGNGIFAGALDKIDEANRAATRLHQMIYRHNKAVWALTTNMQDGRGRPLPAPTIGGGTDTLDVEDDSIISLPGMSDLKTLVPPLQFDAALSVLNAMMEEIEADLPELAYRALRTKGTLSGKAVRTLLGDAIDKLMEARANGIGAVKRANMMALSVGVSAGIFRDIGKYADGDFEYKPLLQDPFQAGLADLGEVLKDFVDSGVPILAAMELLGSSDYTLDIVRREMQADQLRQVDLATAYIQQAEIQANRNGALV